jgi:hypothetical protein
MTTTERDALAVALGCDDISRDVDIFFEPAAEAGWIRKGRA